MLEHGEAIANIDELTTMVSEAIDTERIGLYTQINDFLVAAQYG